MKNRSLLCVKLLFVVSTIFFLGCNVDSECDSCTKDTDCSKGLTCQRFSSTRHLAYSGKLIQPVYRREFLPEVQRQLFGQNGF